MKYFLSIVLILSGLNLLAQPQIEFANSTHDFGTIKEDGGIVEVSFEFTNTGNQPLILNNVRTTCGCTSPSWTREPVLPGNKGFVKVGYNPINRPGAFSQNATVFTNSQPATLVLNIRGVVSPRERTLEEQFPREMGATRWRSNFISMGNVARNETKESEIEFMNTGDKAVNIEVNRAPAHLSVKFEPAKVEPGKTAKMLVTYNAEQRNAWGSVSDRIYLAINDERLNNFSVMVSANIQEDFSKLSKEELDNAPVASFDNTVFDFGTIKQGERATNHFKLTNTGKSDLLIRNVRAACGCTAVKHDEVVKPGEYTLLTVDFNSRGQRNRQNKSITVITNDPKNSTTILRVMGTVIAD